MSFWTDMESAISTAIKGVEAELVTIAHALNPLAVATAEEVGQIALQSVMTQATSVASGQEKMSAAVSNVVSVLATQGKSVLASQAQTAIQLAYNMASASIPKPAP